MLQCAIEYEVVNVTRISFNIDKHNMPFCLDRTAHHVGTHEQAARHHVRHQPTTPAKYLRAATYPNSVAYGYNLDNSPLLDRTAFIIRQRAHRNG